jgi:LysR family glycine cleavage system transcriptional activator
MAAQFPGTRALRTFEAAARHLNFTRAADELGLTPAAVSHQIKEIEDRLGVALFARTSRTIRLTEAGAIIREAAVDALDTLARAAAKTRRLARGAAELKISMDPTFASKWLMPKVEDFRRLHGDIELRFDVTSKLRDFEHDDIDVGIRFGRGRYPGVTTRRLFDNIIIPVCSPRLLKSGPPLAEPRDLLRHTLVHIEWARQGITWPNWRIWMAAAGIEDFDDSRCIVFEESSQLIQAAIDGNAVALCDFAMVANDLSDGRLIRPFDLGIRVPAEFAYFLAYPTDSAGDARIKAFEAWILGEAAKGGEASPSS